MTDHDSYDERALVLRAIRRLIREKRAEYIQGASEYRTIIQSIAAGIPVVFVPDHVDPSRPISGWAVLPRAVR